MSLPLSQNRADCKTFFSANKLFFGCSYASNSFGNYVLVNGMRRAKIPVADYVGVRAQAPCAQTVVVSARVL